VAWVAAQEVRQELPNNGRGVTEAQLERFTDEGKDMVTLGDSASVETILGDRAVKAYAKAEALKVMRAKGDPITPDEIRLAEEAADRFAAAYRMSTETTSDDAGTNYKGIVMETPW
jgi:hypothetical protein